MIAITRLNGKGLYINPDLIEFIEETPDSVVTLTTGRKVVASEPAEELIGRIITYRRSIFSRLPTLIDDSDFSS